MVSFYFSDQVFILFLLNFKLDVMISEFLENFYCVVLKHFYILDLIERRENIKNLNNALKTTSNPLIFQLC